MQIIIVGGGVVGSALAEQLLRDGHHLAMIELDKSLSTHLSEKHDLQILSGSGSSPALLAQAGIQDADMVLAVTPEDEVNIVVCGIAAHYNVKRRIARLRSREYTPDRTGFDLSSLGITDVIHPEKVMVDHILQFIETPHAVESADFENSQMLLRGYLVRPGMALATKTPQEIRREIAPAVLLFAAINRNGVGMIPDGNTRIEPGDILYTLFPRESLDAFLKLVGVEHKKRRKIIATGDSFAMVAMSHALQNSDNKVIVVDPDIEHAKKLAGMFGHIEVIHGDCTDADLLRELHVNTSSFFVSVSNQSDYNILSCLLAKAEGAHEVIATSTETRHDRLFMSIGIDHVINPRLTAAREILEIISRGRIGAAVQLAEVDIEAADLKVDAASSIAGKKIKTIAKRLKRGTIIGVIIRDNRMIIPDGETIIEPEDSVIVITEDRNLKALTKLFKPSGPLSQV
jgi:trk system potassium uptake protein TrkA